MKKIILALLVFLFVSIPVSEASSNINSEGAVVYNLTTNEIKYSKNLHHQYYPASLVKILASKRASFLPPTFIMDVPGEHSKSLPRSILIPGDRFTRGDIIHTLMINSANDVAELLDEKTSIRSDINKAAQKNNLDLHLKNLHGLHDPGQYVTPYSFIKMFNCFSPNLEENILLPSMKEYYILPNGEKVTNTNRFSTGEFEVPGYVGGKSGYTSASNYNLATFIKKGAHYYIIAVFNGPTRDAVYTDTINLEKTIEPQYYKEFTATFMRERAINAFIDHRSRETLVPVREIFESLGYRVSWDHKNRKVNIDNSLIRAKDVVIINNRSYISWEKLEQYTGYPFVFSSDLGLLAPDLL